MSAQKKFLPSTPLGWIVATTLVVVALFFSMYPLARITGQRLGMVVVDGYSLHNIIPYGSSVFVLPMAAYDGQIVSAWAPEGIDDPENQEDRRPTPVLKVLKGGQLVSTNIDQTVSKFEIRGVVVASIPPLPWMRGENENPSIEEGTRIRFARVQCAGGLILQGKEGEAREYLRKQGSPELFSEAVQWAGDERQRQLDKEFVEGENPWTIRLALPDGPAEVSQKQPVPNGDWAEIEVVLQATAASSCVVKFNGESAIALFGDGSHTLAVPSGARSVTYTLQTFGPGESIAILQVGGTRAR